MTIMTATGGQILGFQGVYLDVRGGLVDIVKSDNFDYFYIILL